MASYDLSALLNSLQEYQRREAREPNNRAIKQYLLNKGVREKIARFTSMNELCYWTEKELDDVFNDLDLPYNSALDSLVSFKIQSSYTGRTDAENYVKPTLEDIQKSASNLGALCVNRNGQFSVNPPEGFAALSHVWSQGLGADDDNRGLHRSLLQQVFDRIEPLGIRWIWTDSLAIPGGKRALNFIEEELKGALINAMANIYRQARIVVIFDALCLRLNSIDPVKVAVVTCLGPWMTRMWTYQEIKLATNAIIATKSGFVGFDTIIQSLKSFALNEVGAEYMMITPGRYPSLYKTLMRLQRNDELGVSLPDLAIGCGYREAWDRLDYARALFPTLGAEWKTKYDIHQAMQEIYLSQKYHATQLALFHGPPRASYPGWAPAVFNGLVECEIIEPGTWKLRGMQRTWLTTRVLSIVPSKEDRIVLSLESDFADGALTVGFISEETQEKSPKSIEFFRKAVREGTAYLLSEEPLFPKRHFSRIGLLVARFTKVEEHEAWVCLTLAVGETQETYKYEKKDWLLLHENPVSDQFMSGKSATELVRLIIDTSLPGAVDDYAQIPLHQAARGGHVEECRRLLATSNVNTRDSRGWTALHLAAAVDQRDVLPLLIGAGADINAFDYNGQSPLCLAIDNSHHDAVVELWEAGADVNASHRKGYSPLCTAVRRGIELTTLLLALGADPSLVDAGGCAPLNCAINGEDEESETLEALLEARGDPNVGGNFPILPLVLAALQGNSSATQKLLAYGADPNAFRPGREPPLYDAIVSGSLETVRALVDNGANCTVRFGNGRTPMMLAAESGDHEMGKLLQSKGVSLNGATSEGLTPLHIAAMSGSRIFYKWLLASGANKNAKDARGKTASELIAGF